MTRNLEFLSISVPENFVSEQTVLTLMKWLLANVHSNWFSVKKIGLKLAYKEFQVLFKDKCSIK